MSLGKITTKILIFRFDHPFFLSIFTLPRERDRGAARPGELFRDIDELSARAEVGALICTSSCSGWPGIGAAAIAFKGAACLVVCLAAC